MITRAWILHVPLRNLYITGYTTFCEQAIYTVAIFSYKNTPTTHKIPGLSYLYIFSLKLKSRVIQPNIIHE